MKVISIISGAVGIVILILAIVLGFVVFPNIVEDKVIDELKLVRGSTTWNKWIDIENPIYISFYVFDVKNADEVENEGAIPVLEQRGPYVYRERRQKYDPHSESCKETVTYWQNITYWFDYEKSGDNKETDIVNVVNVPFVSLITVAQKLMPDLVTTLSSALSMEGIVRRNVAVGDLIFKGWDTSSYGPILPYLPESFQAEVRGGFAIFKGKNGSSDGMYEIYSGAWEGGHKQFGEIKKWNNASELGLWGEGTQCDKIEATDGSIFRPFLKEEDTIRIFSSDLCRPLQLDFKEEVTVKDIKGYRFSPSQKTLQGAANNPDNACYCRQDKPVSECVDGIFDVSGCRNGAPVYLSTPYWLDGHQRFNELAGLGPADRDKHEIRVEVEPRTGLLLHANKRIQINVEVQRFENSGQFYFQKQKYLFPFLWLDEDASICDIDAQDLKDRVIKPVRTINIVRWIGIGVGAALVLGAIAIYLVGWRKSRKVTTA